MALTALIAQPVANAPPLAGTAGAANLALTVAPIDNPSMLYWCWAAVAASVSCFYSALSTWSQCAIASDQLGLVCCGQAPDSGCDSVWTLEAALTCTGNLANFAQVMMDAPSILEELTAGSPVCVRIEWSDGSGHFIAISGIDLGAPVGPTVIIGDPIYKSQSMPLSLLANNYQQAGSSWTHSYTTQGGQPAAVPSP